jgi:hypothetical protein
MLLEVAVERNVVAEGGLGGCNVVQGSAYSDQE